MMLDLVATRTTIAQHSPHDALEAFHQANMLRLLDESPTAPFTRKHFTPGHFTASAYVLAQSTRQLLLVHHAKSGQWFQPGGHLEETDDSLLAGALREVREECGATPQPTAPPRLLDLDIHFINRHKDEPDHAHFDCRFLVLVAESFTIKLDDPVAVPAAKWVSLTDVATLMRHDPSNSRVINKLAVLQS